MKNNPSLITLLALALLLGLFTLADFGESWDELQFYKYADHALESYAAWFQSGEIIITGNTYDNYGPAFVMLTQLAARALNVLDPGWLLSDLRHLIYFVTFLGGVAAFRAIARRLMNGTAAFAATLLFMTQPLFWGHAFVSPKDIPFLSLFLISIALGLRMVDSELILEGHLPRNLIWLTGLWMLSLLILFVTPRFLDDRLSEAIQNASANPAQPLAAPMRAIASDFGRVDSQIYVQKARIFFIWSKLVYLFISTLVFGLLYRKHYPAIFTLFAPQVILASFALGITASIRVLAPLAGLLVTYCALRNVGKKAFPLLISYGALAFVIMLASWPYLWPDPLVRLGESFQVMSQYPWKGQVLFDGEYYASTDLPLSYLPLLLALQFTEPVWPLFALGLFALRKSNFALIATLVWLILPLAGIILTHAPLYDNTRQIFFLLPPVFLVAGLGVDWLLRRITRPVMRALILGLLILPGIIAGARLHPYEYVYYNSLIGNPEGRFELDYWATSYREAAEYLNESAPANAIVEVIGPAHIVELYIRNDLVVLPDNLQTGKTPDYAIITSRYGFDRQLFTEAEVVYRVERAGMTFAVIKNTKH
ncbi:MAG: hypothetical protein A2Z03_09885 [Chloroflexi bacterium RBG_16_56_8]|nr:MAG: hypothetical protein A2Z03_09885 [Chloroflexi bacterium RBG_16_56_8]